MIKVGSSYKKGAIFSSIFGFISKIIAFSQGIFITYYFGATTATDIYYYLFSFFVLLFSVVNAVTISTIIPQFTLLYEQKGKDSAISYVNFFIYFFIGVALILEILFYIFPYHILSFISQFKTEVIQKNIYIIFFLLPILLFSFFNTIVLEILVSFKYFIIPHIVNMINNIIIIGFIVIFNKKMNELSLSVGILTGYLINTLCLLLIIKRRIKWNFSIVSIPLAKKTLRNAIQSFFGAIITLFSTFFPLYLISNLNNGIVTLINFTSKIIEAPIGMISLQLLAVLGIKMNELRSRFKENEIGIVFDNIMTKLLIIMFFITLCIFSFRKPILTILYGHGKLDETSINSLSKYVSILAFYIPFSTFITGIGKVFYSFQKIKPYLILQVIMSATLILLSYLLIPKFEGEGYVIAQVVAAIINCIVCIVYIKKYNLIQIKKTYFSLISIIISTCIIGFIVFLL